MWGEILSLRPFNSEIVILAAYVAATRIFSLSAAKLGVEIMQVPLFLTDFTLLALLAFALIRRPGRWLMWLSSGRGATGAGLALWLLCALSAIYFLEAFRDYRIMAVRDLAIFGYCLFFPLTYFAVGTRLSGVRITRYCVYSGVVLAALMATQHVTGLNLWMGALQRNINGVWLSYVGGDDYGAVVASSMMGLIAYLILERGHRRFHLVGAILCLVALSLNGARSAVVGVALCAAVTFIALSIRHRISFAVACAIILSVVLISSSLPQSIPGVSEFNNFTSGVSNALGGNSDLDRSFRIARWQDVVGAWLTSPALGVGYGRDILHRVYVGIEPSGKFNEGMPHNTYLFILARMGLVGACLIGFAMMLGMWRLFVAVRRYRLADDLAAMSMLVTLAGYGAFVLFFERPMNNAGFWIMLAVGLRLTESSRAARVALTRQRTSSAGDYAVRSRERRTSVASPNVSSARIAM